MHITGTDRILVAVVAAYMGYRLWSGLQIGIVYGDGDDDVHADKHPTAYVLTCLSCLLVIGLLAYIALGDAVIAALSK